MERNCVKIKKRAQQKVKSGYAFLFVGSEKVRRPMDTGAPTTIQHDTMMDSCWDAGFFISNQVKAN